MSENTGVLVLVTPHHYLFPSRERFRFSISITILNQNSWHYCTEERERELNIVATTITLTKWGTLYFAFFLDTQSLPHWPMEVTNQMII